MTAPAADNRSAPPPSDNAATDSAGRPVFTPAQEARIRAIIREEAGPKKPSEAVRRR